MSFLSGRMRTHLLVALLSFTTAITLIILLGCAPPPKPPPVVGPAQPKELAVTGGGSALERLTSEDVSEEHPAISPDGTTLLFEVRLYGPGSDVPLKQTLVAINPNTRAQRTLYTADTNKSDHPAWLPDGTSYLYASDSPGSWSLVRALTAAPNAAVGVIASGEIAPNVSWPSVAPDGRRVTFSTQLRGIWTIAVINIDGAHLTLLGEGTAPAWSPDGSRIAFSRSVGDHDQLFLVNPDTGGDLVQLTTGEWDNQKPAWSPDAQYIVFSSTRGWKKDTGESKRTNLFVTNRDGTGLTQLTSGSSFARDPNWGRDGWIYFASDQAGNFDIWRLKPTGAFADLPSVRPAGTGSTSTMTKPLTSPGNMAACMKDTDCKGDRICDKGTCVSPTK
jgi:Tol biopolymer transport system component